MLPLHTLLFARLLVAVIAQDIIEIDGPCLALPTPSNTSETSVQLFGNSTNGQPPAPCRRIVKRQAEQASMAGCGNEQLSQIMQHVLGPLLSEPRLRLGDVAQILQQSVQRATGKSFEVMLGKGEMGSASHQMSETAQCRMTIGGYHSTIYETPVQYNINDAQQERELSNIDFGERLGGSGYPGQQPFPRFDSLEASLRDFNALFKNRECFSGDLTVETIEGAKRMSELETGDEVLSIDGTMISYSPIIMFLHRDEKYLAEFNVITTANGSSVRLTNEHLIYVSDCDPNNPFKLVRAKEVCTEHCLITSRSPNRTLSIERIINVTKIYERGIYAPLTSTGEIIVNDVLSSCHSNLAIKLLQQSFFSVYRSIQRFFSFFLPEEGGLPIGIEHFTNALDLFIPTKKII